MTPSDLLREAAGVLRAGVWPHTGPSWIPLAGPGVRGHLAALMEAAATRNQAYGGVPALELALAAEIVGAPVVVWREAAEAA